MILNLDKKDVIKKKTKYLSKNEECHLLKAYQGSEEPLEAG
jgi:hypothetical protein